MNIEVLEIVDQPDGTALVTIEMDKAARDTIISQWFMGVLMDAANEAIHQSATSEVSKEDGSASQISEEAAEQQYLACLFGEDNHLIPLPTDERPNTGKRHKKRKHKKGRIRE